MSAPPTGDRGGRPGSSDQVGSIGWTERTGGVLTARECVTLARPLLRGELGILAGLLAMALRVHSGRRATIEPARLAPPDSSLPSPVPHVDFTVRSAALAREFADHHGVPVDSREVVTNAIAMHHTPGVGLESGPEAYLMSAGAAVDVFGLGSNEIPDAVRRRVVEQFPRLASSGSSPRCGARRPSRSPAAGRGSWTASPSAT